MHDAVVVMSDAIILGATDVSYHLAPTYYCKWFPYIDGICNTMLCVCMVLIWRVSIQQVNNTGGSVCALC